MKHYPIGIRFLSRLASGFSSGRSRPASVLQHNNRQLLVIVEGRNDIEFLRNISAILHVERPDLPDLAAFEQQGRLIFVPAGGGDFRPWTTRFAGLGLPEFHLYDRELEPESQRRQQCAAIVNARPGCRAVITTKRCVECYLHPQAILEARGLVLAYGDTSDVPQLAAEASFVAQDGTSWQELSRRARLRLRDRAKTWLNTAAARRMTLARLLERDPEGEIVSWLTAIGQLVGHGQ